MKNDESIMLIGRYWEILTKLSGRKYNLSQLARELGKSPSLLTRQLKRLVEKGLVGYEKEREGRHKYYYITDYANVVLKEIMSIVELKPKGKPEEWQIENFLNILESENSSVTLREFFAESFASMCREYPLEVISYPRVRKLFEKVLKDELDDCVAGKLKVCVPFVLRYVSRHMNWFEWLDRKVYPLLERNVEVSDEQTRLFAIKVIGEIAVNSIDPFLKSKVEKKLLEIWYSPDTDPNGDVGVEALKWFVLLSSRWLFDDAKARVKDDRYKAKAELLLEMLKGILMPK